MNRGGFASCRVMKAERRKKKIFMDSNKLQAVSCLARNTAAMSVTQPVQPPKRVPVVKAALSPQLGLDPSEDCTVQGQAGAG